RVPLVSQVPRGRGPSSPQSSRKSSSQGFPLEIGLPWRRRLDRRRSRPGGPRHVFIEDGGDTRRRPERPCPEGTQGRGPAPQMPTYNHVEVGFCLLSE